MRTTFAEVVDGVYVFLGTDGMSNAVAIDGEDDGWTVVDSLTTPGLAQDLVDTLGRVRGGRISMLVNTHYHGDHTFGNGTIPTSRILAHPTTAQTLREIGEGYLDRLRNSSPKMKDALDGAELRLPTETLEGELRVRVGPRELTIRSVGRRAHTAGDLVLEIPDQRVLLIGDLIFNGTVPVMRDGDIDGLSESLLELRSAEVDVVIPGHGAFGDLRLIDQQLEFIDQVVEDCRRVAADGGDASQAEQVLASRFDGLLHPERLAQWVEKAFASRKQA